MEWLPIAIIVAIAALDMVVVVIFSRETYSVPLEDLGKIPNRNDVKPRRADNT